MPQKDRASPIASACKAFSEYLTNPKTDLGRVLATTRTLFSAWVIVAAFCGAMLLAPAAIRGVQRAGATATHVAQLVRTHHASFGRGLCALIAARESSALPAREACFQDRLAKGSKNP